MVSNAPRLAAGLAAEALALLLLAACSSGPGGSAPPPPPPPATDTTAPSVPTGVVATAPMPTQILVSWTASTDAGTGVAGYRVYRDGSNTALASVTTTSYTDSTVLANTLYSYTVRAFDGATPPNESAQSGSVSATTPPVPVVDITPPSIPANVTAAAQSIFLYSAVADRIKKILGAPDRDRVISALRAYKQDQGAASFRAVLESLPI